MMNVDIRLIAKEELPLLYALRQAILRKPLGLNLYDKDFTEEKNWISFGAFAAEKMIGCVMLSQVNENTIQLRQMAVGIDYQGNGVGNLLLQSAQKYCSENNYNIITLHARENAISFYKKFGFTIIGDKYIEVGIPHFTMQKTIE
jgi:predicted GNAT family N-acyltransferase